MKHAVLVRIMDCAGDIHHETGRGASVFAKPRKLIAEATPFDQLHAEIMLPLMLADFVDRHDVRMVEVGGRLGLGMEPLDGALGSQLTGQNHLQGHQAMEAHLPRLIDHAHAAAGDLLQQLVIAEIANLGFRHCGRCAVGGNRRRIAGQIGRDRQWNRRSLEPRMVGEERGADRRPAPDAGPITPVDPASARPRSTSSSRR